MTSLERTVTELQEQLAELAHTADPDPFALAGLELQLGMTLLRASRYGPAEEHLAAAAERFDPNTSPHEHAVALNLLGVVCRDTRRPDLAAELFMRAADAFERAEAVLERGGALHNLGLTHRDRGDVAAAIGSFREARQVLDPEQVPAQAATNLRELGTALLTHGDLDEANTLLEEAADLSGRAGDVVGEGGAANALGLGRLAAGEVGDAIDAFLRAVAAHPRTIRPDAYAMARSNLALAYEAAGDQPRARLAAAQALAVPEAPAPVVRQSRELLDRLGHEPDDLHAALDSVGQDEWEATVRPEVDRWTLIGDDDLGATIDGWLDGLLRRDGQRVERMATVVGRLLELPPPRMERLVEMLVERTRPRDEDEQDRIRSAVSRSLARFAVPQWMRLRAVFTEVAGEDGWG